MNKIFNLLKNNSVYLKYNQNRYNQILKSLKVKKKNFCYFFNKPYFPVEISILI